MIYQVCVYYTLWPNLFLRAQHLTGLELVAEICRGKLENGAVGSTEVTLTPGKVKAGSYKADTKTAG